MTVDLGAVYNIAIKATLQLGVDVTGSTVAYAKIRCSEDNSSWVDYGLTASHNTSAFKTVNLGCFAFTRIYRFMDGQVVHSIQLCIIILS